MYAEKKAAQVLQKDEGGEDDEEQLPDEDNAEDVEAYEERLVTS